MKTVTVDADALRQVLQALNGPGHHIRELQAIRGLGDSPIDKLVEDYNKAAEEFNRQNLFPSERKDLSP